MLWVVFLFVSAVSCARFCLEAKTPLDLPTCSDDCLKGDFDKVDGVCADNLDGICFLEDYVKTYFRTFGACLIAHCRDDHDRYLFMKLFKDTCEKRDYAFDIDSAPSDLARVLKNPPTSRFMSGVETITITRLTTVTGSSSLTAATTSRALLSSGASSTESFPSSKQVDTSLSIVSSSRKSGTTPPYPPDPTAILPTNTGPPEPTSTPADPLTPMTTPQIIGTAAGGTVFFALLIGGTIYLLRRRSQSRSAAPPNWDPSGGSHGKPTLPDISGGNHGASYEPTMRGGAGGGGGFERAELHGNPVDSATDYRGWAQGEKNAGPGYSPVAKLAGPTSGPGGGATARLSSENHGRSATLGSRLPSPSSPLRNEFCWDKGDQRISGLGADLAGLVSRLENPDVDSVGIGIGSGVGAVELAGTRDGDADMKDHFELEESKGGAGGGGSKRYYAVAH